MKPETARYLDKARQCLADAERLQAFIPRVASREAYLAAFHASEALLYERRGRITKTHRGIRAQFALLAKEDSEIDHELPEFLGRGYELKSLADCGTGAEAIISTTAAASAVAPAKCFVENNSKLLQEAP